METKSFSPKVETIGHKKISKKKTDWRRLTFKYTLFSCGDRIIWDSQQDMWMIYFCLYVPKKTRKRNLFGYKEGALLWVEGFE